MDEPTPLDRRLGDLGRRPPSAPPPVERIAHRAQSRRRRRRRVTAAGAVFLVAVLAGTTVSVGLDDPEVEVRTAGRGEDGVSAPATTGDPGPRTGPQGDPDVTITPASGLVDGQEVRVEATGVPPQSAILMCAGDATPETAIDRCDFSTWTSFTYGPSIDTTYQVVRLIYLADGTRIDCAQASDACAIAIGNEQSNGVVVPVSFDPEAGPVSEPKLAAEPVSGLREGDVVNVQGTDFRIRREQEGSISVVQCAVDPAVGCSPGLSPSQGPVEIEGDGGFETDVTVTRRLFTPAGFVDCATIDPGCELQARTFTGADPPAVALSFDPAGPVPAEPRLSLEPPGPIAPGEELVVRGTGLPPRTDIRLGVCPSSLDPQVAERCTYFASLPGARTDDEGNLRIGPATLEPSTYFADCAAAPGECYLGWVPPHFGAYVRLDLTFEPSG